IFSSALALGCIAVNVGMLQQIIEGIGLIPPDKQYFGVALSTVLAGLITVVETGVGFFLGAAYSHATHQEGRRLTSGVIVSSGLAGAMALVEGFFYSQIAASPSGPQQTFHIPFIDARMTQEDLFFIWGAALVTSLMLFGLWFHTSLETVLRTRTPRTLRRQLRNAIETASQYRECVGAIEM